MKTVLSLFTYYKKESILAPLFKLAESCMDLIVPLVIAMIINKGLGESNTGVVVRCFIFLLILAAAGLVLSFTAQFFAARASVGMASLLRKKLFHHIETLTHRELDTLGTDTLITRMTSDINQVQNGLNLTLRLLLRSPFIVLGAMVMAFTIDVKCAVIFAVVIPILAVVIFGLMLAGMPLMKKVQAGLDRLVGATRENLTGVRVIRAFRKEEAEIASFDDKNEALTRFNLAAGRLTALMNPLTFIIINVAAVILIRTGAIEVSLGQLQQGDVVALYNYMAQITVELVKLASLIISINKAMASADRIEAVLKTEPSLHYVASGSDETESARNTRTVPGKIASSQVATSEGTAENDRMPAQSISENEPCVVFDHVTFSYTEGADPALQDVSFSIENGKTVGIIGGTGSGKSTLVNLMMRFYDPEEGSIRFRGRDVKDLPAGYLTENMAIVPQKAVLFEGTIRDNLRWGNESASDEALLQAAATAQALEVIEGKGGLDAEVEQNGRNLSGGQRQRLTIARALVKQAPVLILDDSASALDYATDLKLRRALAQLPGDMTTFIVSQRISAIRSADIILVMDDGELVGTGTHESLLETSPVYQEIYASQYPGKEVGA
ncbi:MAG: ABC transporter ATP-binding protein [Lachnospiraceae bacterium]|nr:ABC transporter ATP-binding protein [Lachnospiraceae bacterium]